MTYAEAIQFLFDLGLFGARFGLETTRTLAERAGNPQNQLRFIHVAGTNGKGSTCAMLESIYRAAGLRVGLFTSPHLVSFRERIQVDRELISEADVVRLVAELRELVAAGILPAVPRKLSGQPGGRSVREPELGGISEAAANSSVSPGGKMPPSTSGRMPDATTFFEFVTVMALCYFAEQKCDLVIWETGLGGRLDATNIVTPLAGVITNIQFDHQQWLGDTLAKIAAEKAGIIKPGVPVITATDEPEALRVIEAAARENGSELTKVGQARRLSGTGGTPALPLLGEHQRLNAALAVATVEVLQNQIPVSDAQVHAGLSRLKWPGRLQVVKRPSGQTTLLDGAHNIAGAKTLRQALEEYFPNLKLTLLLGILQDKDWDLMCGILAPLASRIVTVPVASDRTALPEALLESCRSANPNAQATASPSLADALSSVADAPFVVITGSLYLVGEAMERLNLAVAPIGDEMGLNEWTARK